MKKEIILETDTYNHNANVLQELEFEYPLTSLVIELTNMCNLNCVHCYGQFGKPAAKKNLQFEDIVNLKRELDKLHTMEVRLSGGECLLNPEFDKIAVYLLENGFRVGIYTNGFETTKLKSFLNKTKQYHYYMAISLDGMEKLNVVQSRRIKCL